jgi:hypothetical protein
MLAANYIEVEQNSPEWLEMRKGMATGSMVRHAIAKLKRQPKEGVAYMQCREDYMEDIVTTRLTGLMSDRYVSKAMQEGIEREADAIIAYEEHMGVMVAPGGFIYHPEMEWYGTSPDGLVGDSIVIEAKCPTQATHLRYIREARDARLKGLEYVPEEYIPQVKAHLSCSGREVCHFISWHPDFPPNLRFLLTQWSRDKQMLDEQDSEVCKFLDEAEKLETEMRGL